MSIFGIRFKNIGIYFVILIYLSIGNYGMIYSQKYWLVTLLIISLVCLMSHWTVDMGQSFGTFHRSKFAKYNRTIFYLVRGGDAIYVSNLATRATPTYFYLTYVLLP